MMMTATIIISIRKTVRSLFTLADYTDSGDPPFLYILLYTRRYIASKTFRHQLEMD